MDVRIFEGEEIRITATDRHGKEHRAFVSYQQVLEQGTKLIDGLAEDEVLELECRRKIMAIKLYRLRTGCNLKVAKEQVEEWIRRNRCCIRWPYCEHEDAKCLDGLDMSQLSQQKLGDLAWEWFFPDHISKGQAQGLQEKAGYPPTTYGFFSFRHDGETTRWASNRLTPNDEG